MKRRQAAWVSPLFSGAVVVILLLAIAACAPAAPVAQAPGTAATSTAPVVQPGPPPAASMPTPPLPPPLPTPGTHPRGPLDLPTIQELMAGGMTEEQAVREQARIRDETEQRWIAEGKLRIIPASGPSTAGTAIRIAGKTIQLPPDVYIEGIYDDILCAPNMECAKAKLPIYSLQRGARIVDVDSEGRIYVRGAGWVATPPPGFEFLQEIVAK